MSEFGRQSRVFFDDSVSEYESGDEGNEGPEPFRERKRGDHEGYDECVSSEHSSAGSNAVGLSEEEPDEVVMSDKAAVDERANGTVVG